MRNIEEIIGRQIRRWNHLALLLKKPGAEGYGEAVQATGMPAHPAIAVSRQFGSGAREICEIMCERLGYSLMGTEIVDAVAREMNVRRQLVESLDERSRNELQLMLESFMEGTEITSDEYIASLARVLNVMALRGGVILEGRGAGLILKNRTALNVLVIAPLEERIQRQMRYLRVGESEARAQVLDADRERHRFGQKYLKIDVDDPSHYDLVINTQRIAPRQAAELVFTTLELRGFPPKLIAVHLDNPVFAQ